MFDASLLRETQAAIAQRPLPLPNRRFVHTLFQSIECVVENNCLCYQNEFFFVYIFRLLYRELAPPMPQSASFPPEVDAPAPPDRTLKVVDSPRAQRALASSPLIVRAPSGQGPPPPLLLRPSDSQPVPPAGLLGLAVPDPAVRALAGKGAGTGTEEDEDDYAEDLRLARELALAEMRVPRYAAVSCASLLSLYPLISSHIEYVN